jgi:sugar lactone lactonase YvrE
LPREFQIKCRRWKDEGETVWWADVQNKALFKHKNSDYSHKWNAFAKADQIFIYEIEIQSNSEEIYAFRFFDVVYVVILHEIE